MQTKNTVRLYNTLSREVEDFIPVNGQKVGLYACGPTVYDYTHIGHIRKYMFDDVLIRLLRYLAYEVTHVVNITDVGHLISDSDTGEDKLEKGARREGKTAWEVAKFYEDYFFKTMEKMGIKRADIVCRATGHIKEQIILIKTLEIKGFTYTIADGVYFDSTKFPTLGKLSGIDPEKQLAGARIEQVPGKKHPTDFALWKFSYPGGRSFDSAQDDVSKKRHMEWESPWGKGFPGWHIECSAMSLKYLGHAYKGDTFHGESAQTIDIHTGGIDHIAIHHTNEIAQSESATGKQFVKYWVHHNFLLVEGKKMSKSLGNFYTLDDVAAKGFEPLALRYLFLQTHYRQESNFTWEALTGAQTAYNQLKSYMQVINNQKEQGERQSLSEEKLLKVNQMRKEFKDVIRMDLNTPQALAVMWQVVKSNIPPTDKYDILEICDEILGLGLQNNMAIFNQVSDVIPAQVTQLLEKRNNLRQTKQYREADWVRDEIEKLGYEIVDDTSNSFVKKRNLNSNSQFNPPLK